jgi:hypothetical protein
MLLAEDLLLLVTGNVNGRLFVPSAQVDAGLGGANLIELTMMSMVIRDMASAAAGSG